MSMLSQSADRTVQLYDVVLDVPDRLSWTVADGRWSVGRGGKSAAARKTASSGRVSPVGAASTQVKTEGPSGADWVGCLIGWSTKDSDEESYVTACNSNPLLSRTFLSISKDRPTQHSTTRQPEVHADRKQ